LVSGQNIEGEAHIVLYIPSRATEEAESTPGGRGLHPERSEGLRSLAIKETPTTTE
jgi:hypothetical protein